MGTVEMLTLENMGVAFGILSLGGTETEIHLGVIYPPPNCNVRFKKYHSNTRVNDWAIRFRIPKLKSEGGQFRRLQKALKTTLWLLQNL